MLSVLRLKSVLKKLQLSDLTKFLSFRIPERESHNHYQQQQQQQLLHQQSKRRHFCHHKSASKIVASGSSVFGNCSQLSDISDGIDEYGNNSSKRSTIISESDKMATSSDHSQNCVTKDNPSETSSTESSTTSSLADIIKFLELVGSLKHIKRTGWVMRNVADCESISGHMYRMGMMTFLLEGNEGLNRTKCMELAMVHDLAECLVGDITPFCGISKEEKKFREMKAMEEICKLIQPCGNRILKLFQEYEEGESAESKFVKDLDRLDMVLQAFEYEKRDNCVMKHQEFFDSTNGKFEHPIVLRLINEIYTQRKALANEHQNGTTPNGYTSHHNGDGDDITEKKISSS